jgi:hypothetical protein
MRPDLVRVPPPRRPDEVEQRADGELKRRCDRRQGEIFQGVCPLGNTGTRFTTGRLPEPCMRQPIWLERKTSILSFVRFYLPDNDRLIRVTTSSQLRSSRAG